MARKRKPTFTKLAAGASECADQWRLFAQARGVSSAMAAHATRLSDFFVEIRTLFTAMAAEEKGSN